jgi:hypothetical protein
LTSYVLAIANEAGWTIPDGPRGRMEQAQKFVTGTIVRRPRAPTAALSISQAQAVEALSRYDKAEGGGSSAASPSSQSLALVGRD